MTRHFELEGIDWKSFTKKLKGVREKAKLSLGQASRLCDLDRVHYTRIERGETKPSLDTLVKICQGYQITLSELMLRDRK